MSRPVETPLDFRAPEAAPLSDLVARELGRSADEALRLLDFGAVYVNRDRIRDDRALAAGDYVRVHRNPRRFEIAGIDWSRRIIAVTDDCVIVDKPSGLPVHPTCDNAKENVIALVREQLGGTPLFIVQRLDIATQGLMALARSPEACRRFNDAAAQGLVAKRYRALVETAISTGEITHYMMPADRAPRVLSETPHEGWKQCRLVVESCEPVGEWFEVSVRLLTGRMHQIRAQLSALGRPLLGDTLYGSRVAAPANIGSGETIALQSFRLELPNGDYVISAPWR